MSHPTTVIDDRPLRLGPTLRELGRYRELLYFLVWRDVKVRYKQTVLGVAWAVLQPVLTMVIFSVFLGRLAGVPSDGLPYPLFVFTALVPWQLFAHAVTEAGGSLVGNQSLLTKVYFPRLTIPIASVLGALVDFALAFVVLVGMLIAYGAAPGPAVLAVPGFVALALTTALGVGLWLSALNVEYRDVRYVLPFLTQLWLFATPVAYSSGLVPARWRAFYAVNPMVAVSEGFRWALLGRGSLSAASLAVSCAVAVGLVLTGLLYFRRMETTFADVI